MSALVWVVFASLSAGIFNYLMKKTAENESRASSFLSSVMVLSSILAAAFGAGDVHVFSLSLALLGLVAGLFFSVLFMTLPSALKLGPAGLTIGIIQSSCVIPPMIMAAVFGAACGFSYSLTQGFGALLVVAGFTWSVLKQRKGLSLRWLAATFAGFFSLVAVYSIFQYQALHTCSDLPPHPLILSMSRDEAMMRWFLPIFFLATAAGLLLRHKISGLSLRMSPLLSLGGAIANVLANQFLVVALMTSVGVLTLLIVPIYSVLIIVFCNIWSQRLYKEPVDWLGTSVAAGGIILSFL